MRINQRRMVQLDRYRYSVALRKYLHSGFQDLCRKREAEGLPVTAAWFREAVQEMVTPITPLEFEIKIEREPGDPTRVNTTIAMRRLDFGIHT